MRARVFLVTAAFGLFALPSDAPHFETVSDHLSFHQAQPQRTGVSGCMVSVPEDALDEGNPSFKNYQSREVSHLRTETGELPEGTLFKVERGGCSDFMEDYSFIFSALERPISDLRFWLVKASDALEVMARKEKHPHLHERVVSINHFLERKTPIENGATFGPENDSIVFFVMEHPPGKVTTRLVMSAAR